MHPKHELPPVPIIVINPIGQVFQPGILDFESGILESIDFSKKSGKIKVCQDDWFLIETPNPLPHHPEGSDVLWCGKNNKKGNTLSWNDSDWREISKQPVFLNQIHSYLESLSQDKFIYMFIGWVSPENRYPSADFYPMGMQTQARPHFHVVPRYDSPQNGVLIPGKNNTSDMERYLLFLDSAGQASTQILEKSLQSFGSKFIFQRRIGTDGKYRNEQRTMYGFDNLGEAISSILKHKSVLEGKWREYIIWFKRTYPHRFDVLSSLGHDMSRLIKQSVCPNFAVVIPSRIDRQKGQTNENNNIWVIPYTVCNAQEILRGVIYKRQHII